jgi:glucose/arabinose dehydrogenase
MHIGLASLVVLWIAAPPKPLTTGLVLPESIAVNRYGRAFVSEIGERGKKGDGRILALDDDGKATPFATGLDDPRGVAVWNEWMFVADNDKVWRIDAKGEAKVLAAKEKFPRPPAMLNDVTVDPFGNVFVSDSGNRGDYTGSVFRIPAKGPITTVTDGTKISGLQKPNGVTMDGESFLLLTDQEAGKLFRVKIADGVAEMIADGLPGADGLAFDLYGRLFISSWGEGKVWGIDKPGEKPVLVAEGFQSAADICMDRTGKFVLVPDMKAGTVSAISSTIPGREVDDSPLPIRGVAAFPKLKWSGWKPVADDGKKYPLRPLLLTHAGDGSNRNFVIVQQGTIHAFPNRDDIEETKVFLDIQSKVFYWDNENEMGLLGLAFHPKYKENGEFFIYYTLKTDKFTNVISRFRVSKTDPDKADPASEEEIIRVKRPFWNHAGGPMVFGPDGFLYFAMGDGGAANDPHRNGQNLNSHLGKILRIDVDGAEDGKKYRVPKDNPFVGNPNVKPEIWAYGVRNPWRIAFDRETGRLWAGEVGQNLFEEIFLIEKGGNYGWNLREGFHPFGKEGVGPKPDIIEPIWEYHHDLGKSITGGGVYRGKKLPELVGMYLYGDYTSSRLWALKYDEQAKRVVANRPLETTNHPIVSFGEDQDGEMYFLAAPSPSGQGIFRFERTAGK